VSSTAARLPAATGALNQKGSYRTSFSGSTILDDYSDEEQSLESVTFCDIACFSYALLHLPERSTGALLLLLCYDTTMELMSRSQKIGRVLAASRALQDSSATPFRVKVLPEIGDHCRGRSRH
jgi:hypothetical protein